MPHYTALVTLLAVAVYFSTVIIVGRARGVYGVKAPAMTGHPAFERAVRVQANTLEWMPIALPSMWLMAFYVGDVPAAIAGLFWVVARIAYIFGYLAAPEKRAIGFIGQFLAAGGMWGAALYGVVSHFLAGP